MLRHEKLIAEGEVSVNGPAVFDVRFSSPEALRYIRFQLNGKTVNVSFGGHHETISLDEMPDDAAVKLLLSGLHTFLYLTHSFYDESEPLIRADAEINGNPLTASFLPDGRIRQIVCASAGVTIDFFE